MTDAMQYNKPMATDYYTWAGSGDPKDFLDPLNWKDGKVPPMRGASVFVPSGSRIEALEPPRGMMLKRVHVAPDPEGTPPEQCTRIGTINGDRFKEIDVAGGDMRIDSPVKSWSTIPRTKPGKPWGFRIGR